MGDLRLTVPWSTSQASRKLPGVDQETYVPLPATATWGQALSCQLRGKVSAGRRRQLAGSQQDFKGTSAWESSPELVQGPGLALGVRSPWGCRLIQTVRSLSPEAVPSLLPTPGMSSTNA